jgi:hypothetical protein
MDGTEPHALEAPHAYGIALRGHTVAHVWWEQDPDRREVLGWYVRDLRSPAAVQRLHIDRAVEALAAALQDGDDEWSRAASAVAHRTTEPALEHARRLVSSSEHEIYEIHVAGLDPQLLATRFPTLVVTISGAAVALAGRLRAVELANLLRVVRELGGTVMAVVRVPPRLP